MKPLNEAADTLSGDPYPSVSLVLPLLFKLTQVNLAESSDDTALLADLKNLARSALRSAYERDDTQQLLRMAMFLDPRLKRLPFFSKDEKLAVQQIIRKELTKVGSEMMTRASFFWTQRLENESKSIAISISKGTIGRNFRFKGKIRRNF